MFFIKNQKVKLFFEPKIIIRKQKKAANEYCLYSSKANKPTSSFHSKRYLFKKEFLTRGNFFICKLNFKVHSIVRNSYTNFKKNYQKPFANFSDLSTLSGYFFLMTAIRKIWLMTILG
jgi:hypothetical protein